MKRNMKKLILLAGLIFSVQTFAQQIPHFTQFMYNMNVVNPAYAGIKNGLAGGFLYRTQWTGQAENPQTFTFNIHSRFADKMGIGLSAIKDGYGPVSQTDIKVDYSYTLEVGPDLNLALGLNVGYGHDLVDFSSLQVIDPGDPLLSSNPEFSNITYGVGAFLYSSKYYIALSAPNLNTNAYQSQNNSIWTQGRTIHFFGAAGYVFDISNNFKLKPHVMVYKANGAPLAASFNANLFMYDKLELGASYRLNDSFSGLINYMITDNLRIGYAYDRTVSSMKLYSPNSHEFFINFVIPYKHKILMSPIYF
jgi:type IX secretion system PorP/SprF family membrane protein